MDSGPVFSYVVLLPSTLAGGRTQQFFGRKQRALVTTGSGVIP